jgi:hypothetical protein
LVCSPAILSLEAVFLSTFEILLLVIQIQRQVN